MSDDLRRIVEESEGKDAIAYMHSETFDKLYKKNPQPNSYVFIHKNREKILLHYETQPQIWFPTYAHKQPAKAFIELRLDDNLKPGKIVYEKRLEVYEVAAQRWQNGMQAVPPKFVRAPIVRGITEVRMLISLLDTYSGFISGSYSAYCCSLRKHADDKEVGDIDVYLPNMESFNAFCGMMTRLGFKEFKSKYSTYFSNSFGYNGNNSQEWLSKPAAFGGLYAGLWLVNKQINVISPTSLDLSGLNMYKGSELKDKLAARVLGLFDMPACRSAIMSENYAIADARFGTDDSVKMASFDSFRSPEMLLERIQKYRAKGYRAAVTANVVQAPQINNTQFLKDLQNAMHGPINKKPTKKKADSGAPMP